jgi:hypothetical protein
MLIKKLFTADRDPTRPLNEVVNAEESIDVRTEIDEYVFTDHSLAYLRELLEGLLDTSAGAQPECLRTWISGFFGSGKSHFLKLAAALLSNEAIITSTGATNHALEYAVKRHNLTIPWERVAKEFTIRSVIVNLAIAVGGSKQAQSKPLLFRLTSEISRAAGDSAVPHVAELEREIKKSKKWTAFLAAVSAECARIGEVDESGAPREWTDLRNRATDAHRILEGALPSVLPKFTDAAAVRAHLEAMRAEAPSPESVVDLALRLAKDLHPELGRVLLCVDEVALYLTGSPDRVREVQGLAETVKNKGKGKVLLWVTAQQRVDTVDSHFGALDGKVVFLRDRFPARFALEERDIDTVVRERWLKKDDASEHYATLQRLVKEHGGLLARAAKLHEESLLRDADLLTDSAAVVAYYPCLPSHVRLLQAILAALRGEKQVDQTAAQSRALLTAIRALFIRQNGANLAEANVGDLVTFDRVYDVIRDVVRKADSSTDQWITQTIEEKLGSVGAVKVSAVAKVIFLLQRLNPAGNRRIRVDAENIAALLYPRLGAPWDPHLKDVRDACAKLKTEHFIGEEPETGFRFYRAEEKTFQQDVDAKYIDEGKLIGALREAIEAQGKKLGMREVAIHPWHKLPVQLTVQIGAYHLPNPNAQPKSLELHLIWPADHEVPQQAKLWATQYAGAEHLALWHLTGTSDARSLLRKALQLEATIEDYQQRFGQKAVDLLRREAERLATLRDSLIPAAVESAIAGGVVIYRGLDTPLGGQSKTPQEIFKNVMKQAVDQVFTQIDIGAVQVDEATLKKVFSWKPPQPQPKPFLDLKLFDPSGHPLVDRAFLKEIVLTLKGRPENERTGNAILERFNGVPYGWPERAVRAGLAALLRGRRLTVKLADSTVLRAPSDAKAENWLTGTQLFGKGILDLSGVTLSAAERDILIKIFAEVFEAPGADTVEKLEKRAEEDLPKYLARAREAFADLNGRQISGYATLQSLVDVLSAATEPELPIGKLKTLLTEAAKIGASGQELAVLKSMADLLRAVEMIRQQGNLDRLKGVAARAAGLYPHWEKEVSDASIKADLAALSKQVGTECLVLEATRAIDRDSRCFDAYAADYRKRHDERHARAVEALAQLHRHAAWDAAGADARAQLEGPIEALDCDAAADLALPAASAGHCLACGVGHGELRSKIELIEHREQQAMRRLDELLAPPPPSPAPPPPRPHRQSIAMKIASAADLPKLYARIGEVAKLELAQPRLVRVVFDDADADPDAVAGEGT